MVVEVKVRVWVGLRVGAWVMVGVKAGVGSRVGVKDGAAVGVSTGRGSVVTGAAVAGLTTGLQPVMARIRMKQASNDDRLSWLRTLFFSIHTFNAPFWCYSQGIVEVYYDNNYEGVD